MNLEGQRSWKVHLSMTPAPQGTRNLLGRGHSKKQARLSFEDLCLQAPFLLSEPPSPLLLLRPPWQPVLLETPGFPQTL